jgi:hypothetical protein
MAKVSGDTKGQGVRRQVRAMKVEWPDFKVYLGSLISADGAMMRLAVEYRGEIREKLISCDEFAKITGFDDARRFMGAKVKRAKRA